MAHEANATLSGLEQQQLDLAAVQEQDFRAANLSLLVSERLAPGKVLDVGCGGGGLVAYLLARGYDAHGIDASPAIVAAAQEHLRTRGFEGGRISSASLESLVEKREQLDNVVSMDCLEHVANDRAMFESLVSLLRPGGRLVVTVPALSWLYGQRDAEIGHYRRYEAAELLALTEGLPLEELSWRYWNGLGVLPRLVSEKVLGRKMDESFRYGEPSLKARALRYSLGLWFSTVERWIEPPRGLTLLLSAQRRQ